MVFASIRNGFSQVWLNRRMVAVFYLANLIPGLLLLWPFRTTLSRFIDDSLMGQSLGGRISMEFLIDLFHHNPSLMPTVLQMLFVVGPLYLLMNLFLSGGAFAIFAGRRGFSAAEFWGNCGRYFLPLLRLALLALPLLVLALLLQLTGNLAQKVFFGSDPYQYVTYWVRWSRVLLTSFGLFMFFIIFDYSRIYLIRSGVPRARRALREGLRFTFSQFLRTVVLAFSFVLFGALSLAAYHPVADLLAAPSAWVVLLLFLWQQCFMLLRAVLRLSLYAAETHLQQLLAPAGEAAAAGAAPQTAQPQPGPGGQAGWTTSEAPR